MGNRFVTYILTLPLDEVWNRTQSFWTQNNGRLIDQEFNNSSFLRTMVIKRYMSFGSYGETYIMKFGFNPNDSMTYVSIEISLERGQGLQWLKPQGILMKWALEIGQTPKIFLKKPDENFSRILAEIQSMNTQEPDNTPKRYCEKCGTENGISDNFCKTCGSKLEK